MKADNQMKNDHEIEVSKALGNLPLELRAMNEAMKMVFNAVTNAAPPVSGAGLPNPVNVPIAGMRTETCSDPASGVAAPRRIDIETAIMRAPGFDYLLASEIFAALQRRLELEYEDRLDMTLETMMQDLAKAFDRLTGMGK